MYSNKMSSNNLSGQLDNSITVTPIKMEVCTTKTEPQDRSSSASVSSSLEGSVISSLTTTSIRQINDIESEINCKIETDFNNGSTTTVNSNILTPKEKPLKNSKRFVPRKPPPTVDNFWPNILQEIKNTQMVDAKHQALPLARIKKIMKLDENSKMIAAEAPLLFAKACEFFIQELSMRAWIHTEESKRRTLQRSDIAQAIANYDQFDFLIDIVPREDIKPSGHHRKHDVSSQSAAGTNTVSSTIQNTSAIPSKQQPSVATGLFSSSSSSSTTSSLGAEVPANMTISTLPTTAPVSSCSTGAIATGAPPLTVEAFTLSTIPAEALSNLTSSGHNHQQHQISAMSSMAASALQTQQVIGPSQCAIGGQQVQIIQQASNANNGIGNHHSINPHGSQQQMQYFITLPGQQTTTTQHQLQLHQLQFQAPQLPAGLTATSLAGVNLVSQQPQQVILTKAPNVGGAATANLVHQHQAQQQHQQQQQQQHQQATLLQNLATQQQHQQQIQQPIQLLQQVVLTPSGEMANVPVAINANQLNLLRLQMAQQHTTPVQQAIQHQQQQHHTAAQQIIIPSQLLAAQQLLQFQTSTQQQQQQQQQQHQQQQQQQQPGTAIAQNGIYGNLNHVTTQMISNATGGNVDRSGGQVANANNQNTTSYRSNC